MRLRLAALVALALLAPASLVVGASGAWFHSETESYVDVHTDRVSAWLNLYSQGTDPWGDTGYATRVATTDPAATGQDDGISVLFVIGGSGTYSHNRVLKVRTPAAFPVAGVTTVNVTVTLLPDPATGKQPISKYGVDAWGAAPTYTKTITGWAAGTQRQLNLETKFPGKKFGPGVYEPSVVLTLTYPGFTATYYRYVVPVRIEYR